MTADPISLDELERDAITELANIGVSRAAASLREMVGHQVLLSVPSVDILTRRAAAVLISERESDELVAVQQAFAGPFSGRAMLIFPQSNSLHLLRAIIGDDKMRPDEAPKWRPRRWRRRATSFSTVALAPSRICFANR